MFTKVEVLEDNLSDQVLASAPTFGSNSLVSNKMSSPVLSDEEVNTDEEIKWHLTETPTGFLLRKAPMMQQSQDGTATEHYILSDGLSSVSIFISQQTADLKETSTRSGALNVVTYYKNNFAVTLVGAVPKETLKNIFNNLQYTPK
jgi:sigma-E factor negative regulatory protein RseB